MDCIRKCLSDRNKKGIYKAGMRNDHGALINSKLSMSALLISWLTMVAFVMAGLVHALRKYE
jgi:hypothetical protein